ncbi:MAG: hypothetical protein MUC93_06330 [Bacteroidales bacterium]|jgi:hypothetical protein|nr:hypothetical protein [Bacteroidales bacterium]
MRNFLSKYIDTKKLITGLVQATIIGLFVLLWNHLEQLKNFFWPVITYSIKVPVLPTIIVLIITQYFIHKGLLKFQIRFGKKKSITIEKWTIKTNKSTPQWTEYKEIGLTNGLLTSAKCNIELKSDYLRFGFKLLQKNANTFGTGGILTNENNGLFHIGKAKTDDKIFMTSYKNGVQDGTGIFCGNYQNNNPIKLEIKIDKINNLEFFVNGKKYYNTIIKTEYRERLVLMAWGDGNEYEMITNDIEVTTKE